MGGAGGTFKSMGSDSVAIISCQIKGFQRKKHSRDISITIDQVLKKLRFIYSALYHYTTESQHLDLRPWAI